MGVALLTVLLAVIAVLASELESSFGRDVLKGRTNDGVCDECDGGDEPAGLCPNTCNDGELGRAERRRLASQALRDISTRTPQWTTEERLDKLENLLQSDPSSASDVWAEYQAWLSSPTTKEQCRAGLWARLGRILQMPIRTVTVTITGSSPSSSLNLRKETATLDLVFDH